MDGMEYLYAIILTWFIFHIYIHIYSIYIICIITYRYTGSSGWGKTDFTCLWNKKYTWKPGSSLNQKIRCLMSSKHLLPLACTRAEIWSAACRNHIVSTVLLYTPGLKYALCGYAYPAPGTLKSCKAFWHTYSEWSTLKQIIASSDFH